MIMVVRFKKDKRILMRFNSKYMDFDLFKYFFKGDVWNEWYDEGLGNYGGRIRIIIEYNSG